MYAAGCVVAGIHAGRGETLSVRMRIPAIFVVLHVAWGSGFWVGVAEAALRIDTGGGSPEPLPALETSELGYTRTALRADQRHRKPMKAM